MTSRSSATSPTSTTRSCTRRPTRAGRGGSGPPPTSGRSRRLRRARRAAAVGRAAGHRPHHRRWSAHRAPRRQRPRLRRSRRRLLRRARFPEYGTSPVTGSTIAPGRGRRRTASATSGLHPVEGRQARRAVVAHAVGTRPARLAPRMLGDGARVSRRRVRHSLRWNGSRLPAPRERDRSVPRGRRRLRPLLAAQRLGHHGWREDEQVAGQLLAIPAVCNGFGLSS